MMITTKKFTHFAFAAALLFFILMGMPVIANAAENEVEINSTNYTNINLNYQKGILTEDITLKEDVTWYLNNGSQISCPEEGEGESYICYTVTIPAGKTLTICGSAESDQYTEDISCIFDVKGTLVLKGEKGEREIGARIKTASNINIVEQGQLKIVGENIDQIEMVDSTNKDTGEFMKAITGDGTGTITYDNAKNRYLIARILAAHANSKITLGDNINNFICKEQESESSGNYNDTTNSITVLDSNIIDLNGYKLVAEDIPAAYRTLGVATMEVPYGSDLTINNNYEDGNKNHYRGEKETANQDYSIVNRIKVEASFDSFTIGKYVKFYTSGTYDDTEILYKQLYGEVVYQADDDTTGVPANKKVTATYDSATQKYAATGTINVNVPQKEGYTFLGWKDETTGEMYQPGDEFELTSHDLVLTAQWKASRKKVTYTYTVEDTSTTDDNSYEVGTTVTVKAAPTEEKEGFTFQYWRSNDGGKIYYPNDSFVMPNMDITLTAIYKKNAVETYTVTYDAGDADQSVSAMTGLAKDSYITLPTGLTKKGYVFTGWTIEDKLYAPGSNYQITGNVEATATFVEEEKVLAETCDVSFDNNGADQEISAMTGVVKDSYITLPTGLTKKGYVFTGWTIQDKLYAPGSNYQITDNVEATATFIEEELPAETKYSVSYNANGGSNAPETTEYKAGTIQTVATAPAKSGYNFVGYLNSYTGTIMQPGDQFTVLTNIAFTAQWKAVAVEPKTTTIKKSLILSKAIRGNKKITLKWIKVKDASGYEIYASDCGAITYRKIRNTNKLSCIIGKLNNSRAYKFCVKAYKKVNGKKVYLASSPDLHVAMSKYAATNVKRISVSKKAYSLSIGKTAKIKASVKKENKKKHYLNHLSKYRYYSADSSIAKVSSKGVITAVKTGSTKIYVVAENGLYKTIKVTVK